MNDALGNTQFFTSEQLKQLREVMIVQRFKNGTMIFHDGDPADKLYFIVNGRIKTTKSTPDGKSFILNIYNVNDLFGQFEVFPKATCSYGAEAMEDCELGVIVQKELDLLLWQHSDLALSFMKWMATLHRVTETKVRDLVLYGKSGALCSSLIRLSHSFGNENENGEIVIDQKLTNSDLAEMIGATRESVNRMLNELKQNNILDFEHGIIRIRDIHYLQDVCHCENCSNAVCRV
jgi:CRP/FNR family cyclic AMP-dependent transcriptional regulator